MASRRPRDPKAKAQREPSADPISQEAGAAPHSLLGGAGGAGDGFLHPAPCPLLWGAGATFSLSAPSPPWPSAPEAWPGHQPHLCLFLSWETRRGRAICQGVTQQGSERPFPYLPTPVHSGRQRGVGLLADPRSLLGRGACARGPGCWGAGTPSREVLTGEWLCEGPRRRCLLQHGCRPGGAALFFCGRGGEVQNKCALG